jgi:hypothetical protein
VTAERRGIPAAAVMTEQFVSAAELMGRVLGADGHPFVTIPHPISSATGEQLAAAARAAAVRCAALLTSTPPSRPSDALVRPSTG